VATAHVYTLLGLVAVAGASSFTTSSLTLSDAVAGAATSLTLGFTADVEIAVDDAVTLTIPSFSFGTLATPTVSCGTTTFTVTPSGSGTASAVLSFVAQTAAVSAGAACSITVASGVSVRVPTSSTSCADSADASRNNPDITVAATIAGGDNIAAAAVASTPFIADPTLVSSAVIFGSTYAGAPASLMVSFIVSAPLSVGDSLTYTLPEAAFATMGDITYSVGCGDSTFDVTHQNSGSSTAQITYTVASASVLAGVACNITVGTAHQILA